MKHFKQICSNSWSEFKDKIWLVIAGLSSSIFIYTTFFPNNVTPLGMSITLILMIFSSICMAVYFGNYYKG
jgi:uncharacterized membrane protein YdcZ (DUF606 family)